MKDLEELEKKFILQTDAKRINIEQQIEKILKFCRLDTFGHVILEESVKRRPLRDKILIVLAARRLAKELQEKMQKDPTISDVVNGEELQKILGEKKTVLQARVKELKDERKILSNDRGNYSIAPYYIENFLKTLEVKEND